MAKITAQDIMSSNLGGVYINDTNEKTGRYRAFYTSKETVFTHLKDQDGTNVTSVYITTPATSVDGGVLITAQPGTYFSKIKLASGKGWAINEYSA